MSHCTFKESSVFTSLLSILSDFVIFTWPLPQKGSSLQGEILSVDLFICLSVITFSFSIYSIIWWFRPCKPYIFWKLIMLATSTALFWPTTTEYQPLPPSTDPVFNHIWWFSPCNTNIFWKHITLATSTALFWSSITKYHQWRPLPTKYNQVPISTT